MMKELQEKSTSNLIIMVQKLARDISYYKPGFREAILVEVAHRLQEYRNKERDIDD